jgi:hypothetical protein
MLTREVHPDAQFSRIDAEILIQMLVASKGPWKVLKLGLTSVGRQCVLMILLGVAMRNFEVGKEEAGVA